MTFSKFLSLVIVTCSVFGNYSNAAVIVEFCDNHKCNISSNGDERTFEVVANNDGAQIPVLNDITNNYFSIESINLDCALNNINFNCANINDNEPCVLILKNSQRNNNNAFPNMTFRGGNNIFNQIIAIRFGEVRFNEIKSVQEIVKYGKTDFISQKFNDAIKIDNSVVFAK
ncbi:MAG: hypothetical protein IJ848_00385 [Alphaproteobacteria bacterium]|nr:hypothetical protein [Alphaproteobacteria bacterium]